MRVEQIMTTDVVTIGTDASLKDAARRLIERAISGMPVVTGTDVVGVISEADLLVKVRGESPRRPKLLSRLLERWDPDEQDKMAAQLVGEAMTSPAVTIPSYRSVSGAAELMLGNSINRLPVVMNGRLVGIVTRADLVRAFARSDEDIAREIREEIALEQALVGDTYSIDVSVSAGEATLTGRVRRRREAEVLPRIVERVPGVVQVQAELGWAEDE
jgi:CBS domain-containing protein